MNIVIQPVYDPSEIPFPQFCFLRRHGLVGTGASVKLSARVLDDFLEGQKERLQISCTARFYVLTEITLVCK